MLLIRNYLSYLKDKEINELHIFGYSGMNDSHINNAIKFNKSIHEIIYYCNPNTELDNSGVL